MCHLHLKLCTPTGRAVFQIFAEFLGVFALDVHDKPNEQSGCNAHAQVDGVEAGQRRLERGGEALHFKEYTAKQVRKAERPSVLEKLQHFKSLIQAAVVDRTKRKELER